MSVSCSLDDVTNVFSVGGYINDESCFEDSRLPGMLSVLDSTPDLDSPTSLLDSDDDLTKMLEMSQTSPSLLDTCLSPSEGLNMTKTPSYGYREKSSDPYMVDTGLSDPLDVLANSLWDAGSPSSNCDFNKNILDVSYIIAPQIQELSVTQSCMEKRDQKSESNCQQTSEMGDDSQRDINEISVPSEQSNKPKQKRKRRNRGYYRPAKSRRKKTKKLEKDMYVESYSDFSDVISNTPQHSFVIDGNNNISIQPQLAQNSNKNSATKTRNTRKSKRVKKTSLVTNEDNKNTDYVDKSDENYLKDQTTNINDDLVKDNISKPLRRSRRVPKDNGNYNFRLSSLVKRVETERRQEEPRQPKGKEKAPPLSKYRRRTANARERDRMKEINEGFDKLKSALPDMKSSEDRKNKMTKFMVLKLALNYISSLREMLGYEPRLGSTLDSKSINFSDEESLSDTSSSVRPSSVSSSLNSVWCQSGESELDSPTSEELPLLPKQNNPTQIDIFPKHLPKHHLSLAQSLPPPPEYSKPHHKTTSLQTKQDVISPSLSENIFSIKQQNLTNKEQDGVLKVFMKDSVVKTPPCVSNKDLAVFGLVPEITDSTGNFPTDIGTRVISENFPRPLSVNL